MKLSIIAAAIEHHTSIGTGFPEAMSHVLKDGTAARNDWHPAERIYLKAGAHSFESQQPDLVNYIDNIDREHFESWSAGIITRLPVLCKALANGTVMEGWTPSTEDMLTNDWLLS